MRSSPLAAATRSLSTHAHHGERLVLAQSDMLFECHGSRAQLRIGEYSEGYVDA